MTSYESEFVKLGQRDFRRVCYNSELMSGLRRTAIPSMQRAGLDQAKAMNQDSVDSKGRIENTTLLRNNALA
jgi:hypothetical protein